MQQWTIDPRGCELYVDLRCTLALINAIGSHDQSALASAVLEATGQLVPVFHSTILAFEADRNPRLLSAASRQGEHWHAYHTASHYVRGLFRRDELLAHMAGGQTMHRSVSTLLRQSADEIAHDDYRSICYDRAGIGERLTVLSHAGSNRWIATNLFRARSQGAFSFQEIAAVRGLAPLIAGCVLRHYSADVDGETSYRGTVTDAIGTLCPKLTEREREVLLRILDGVTTEKIAADLRIRPTTVITYRTRAYEKLGVASRRELFAAVLRSQGGANRGRANPAGMEISATAH